MSTGNGTLLESEKYHVIRELGRGGMGVVYLAEDRQLRRRVALKVLYDYLNRDRAFVERFQEEACSVSTLHHPNIVCVHGLDRSGEIVAIDMEFVEGVSLDQIAMATSHMAAAIARDVLGGLAACHQIGVVHRDIKPSNILISHVGQAKITDFGLATAYASHMEATLGGNTSSGFYMGTPRYMPIHAWEGNDPEPFWDLYSFGVVLHELVSGRTAFPGANPIEVMRKQLTEPLPPLRSTSNPISLEFSELVEALLNTCREESPLNCAEALDLLRKSPEFKALQESDSATTLAIKPLVKRRGKKPRGGKRPVLAFAGACVLLLVLAGTFYGILKSQSPATSSQEPGPAPAPISGAAFYNAQAINAADEGISEWMVEVDEHGKPLRILGLSELTLWSMDVGTSALGAPLPLTGNWARRLSEEGGASEHGTVEGTVQWDPARDQPVFFLERQRGNDHEKSQWVLSCQRKPQGFGRSEFIRSLENHSAVMTLLYRDLLPRDLDWADAVEAQLPGLPGTRASVPSIAEPIVVDGKLDEPTWRDGAFDGTGLIGELQAQNQNARHRLLMRWDSEAVYVAFDVSGINAGGLEIAVAPKTEVEPRNAGRYVVSIDPAGTVDGIFYLGGTRQAWVCDWVAAMQSGAGSTTVEVKIPTSALALDALPVAGRRWRLNARYTSPAAGGASSIVLSWGDNDVKALEHGALLIFKESK